MTVKISRVMLTIAAVTALTALVPAAASAGKQAKRDVLVVSNNWAGTADLIDPHTFERLDRINVIPDAKKRIAEIHADPTATAFFDLIRELIGKGTTSTSTTASPPPTAGSSTSPGRASPTSSRST